MNWSEQLVRIRRLLRDPSGLIWSEAMLKRIYNDEQNDIFNIMPVSQTVKAISTPPEFRGSYTFDWEWYLTDYANGDVYKFTYYYDSDNFAYTHIWEAEHLKGFDAETDAEGSLYTHPWEAQFCDPAEPAPIPMPKNFHAMLGLYWDRDEITPTTKAELQNQGITTWRSEVGVPVNYWRGDEFKNWIYLYPMPEFNKYDIITNTPITIASGTITIGGEEVTFSSTTATTTLNQGDPDISEYGYDTLDIDGNLLAIYEQESTPVELSTDESILPKWLQKYVEYGVAARAFRANTDGQIMSLADYWDLRKLATVEAIKLYRVKKMKDRTLCLTTKDRSVGARISRRPRLPSHYPSLDG